MTKHTALMAHLHQASLTTAAVGQPPGGDHEYLLCDGARWLRYTSGKAWSYSKGPLL